MQANIALLTEARIPKTGVKGHVRGEERTLALDDKRRRWATAVVSPHELRDPVNVRTIDAWGHRRAPFSNARPGSWTAAVVSVPGVGDVTAVSIYGLLDEKSDASVHRSLSDLTPLFEDGRCNERLLLGGDLNTWTGWPDDPAHVARDEAVLHRIEAFGLVDCLAEVATRDGRGPLEGCKCSFGDACRHTRTRRDPKNPEKLYQMDYLFASQPLAERLLTCEAIDLGDSSPSDHFPIRATFAKQSRVPRREPRTIEARSV